MSEWVVLGIVAAGLYLVECLAWIRSDAVVCFRRPFLRHWRCARGERLPGNDRGGGLFLQPVAWSGSLVVIEQLPFSISPTGIVDVGVGTPSAREPRFIDFDEVWSIHVEFDELHLNGRPFARLHSSARAALVAADLRSIWKRPRQERASAIGSMIKRALDAKGAGAAWTDFQRRTRTLSVLCAAHAVLTFIVAPVVMVVVGPYPTWQFVLAGLVAVTLTLSMTYFGLHAALYAESRYERWVQVISMMLLPVAASRCIDKLSRDSLHRYSWAVVVPLLCERVIAAPILRQKFADLAYAPMNDPAVGRAHECLRWFQDLLARETKRRLDRFDAGVFDPPPREDDTMVSYCPSCHAQFGAASNDICVTCRTTLVQFARSVTEDRQPPLMNSDG
jgi:hypothetical protein